MGFTRSYSDGGSVDTRGKAPGPIYMTDANA